MLSDRCGRRYPPAPPLRAIAQRAIPKQPLSLCYHDKTHSPLPAPVPRGPAASRPRGPAGPCLLVFGLLMNWPPLTSCSSFAPSMRSEKTGPGAAHGHAHGAGHCAHRGRRWLVLSGAEGSQCPSDASYRRNAMAGTSPDTLSLSCHREYSWR